MSDIKTLLENIRDLEKPQTLRGQDSVPDQSPVLGGKEKPQTTKFVGDGTEEDQLKPRKSKKPLFGEREIHQEIQESFQKFLKENTTDLPVDLQTQLEALGFQKQQDGKFTQHHEGVRWFLEPLGRERIRMYSDREPGVSDFSTWQQFARAWGRVTGKPVPVQYKIVSKLERSLANLKESTLEANLDSKKFPS